MFVDINSNTSIMKKIISFTALVLFAISTLTAQTFNDSDKYKRIGLEIYKIAIKNGAFLRPLGNTLYWLPPANIEDHTLQELAQITKHSIITCFK